MNYPEFDSDFLFASNDSTFDLFIKKLLVEKIEETGITVESKNILNEQLVNKSEWINNSSVINIFLNDSFLNNHLEKNDKTPIFYDNLKEILKPLTSISQTLYTKIDLPKSKPFALLTLYYKTKDGFVFKFLFDIVGDESVYLDILHKAISTIRHYNEEGENELKIAVKNSFTQTNEIKYFIYTEDNWLVLNPIVEVTKKITEEYRENKDFRISKPTVLMQRDDFSKHIILDKNWVLEFDGLETMLIKPNDVILYSNISSKNLSEAKSFYEKYIIPRQSEYGGGFPSLEIQKLYYDYFELIIESVIFAYTSIESFANICIPKRYSYFTESNGVKSIYSKEAIERKFTLRDKLKKIITEILNTPDVSKEKWWTSFIKLEEIRNEIIHTKQSISESRYSQFLTKDIFEIIETHKEIINYYGFYIAKNKQDLLNEFPYQFDYDEFHPNLTSKESFEKSIKVLTGR
jgi:hypothetical protein